MKKYQSQFRVFQEICLDTKKSSLNELDTYLICKSGIQIYRYDKNTLCILFQTTHSKKKYLPLFKKEKIDVEMYSEGDMESTYTFKESDLMKVAEIVKPQVKGKSKNPKSKSTIKKLLKYHGVE